LRFASLISSLIAVVSTDTPSDLKKAVTAGDTLQDDTGHLIAEKEFNAALTNKIDSTVVD